MPEIITKHFSSISAEVRFLIKKILDDGCPHKSDELRFTVLAQCSNPEKCTRGVFSGAFRDIIVNSNGAYFSPERGVYQKSPIAGESPSLPACPPLTTARTFSNQIVQALISSADIMSSACTANLLDVSPDDFKVVQKVQSILKEMEELRSTLEERS